MSGKAVHPCNSLYTAPTCWSECQLVHAGVSVNWYMQGVYEPHHDIHMQPYPDSAGGQAYSDQGYGSSSLPAQQTSSANGMRLCYPNRDVSLQADGQSTLITI